MSFDDFSDDLDDDDLKDHEKKHGEHEDEGEDEPKVNEDIDLNSLDLTECAESEAELDETPSELELDELGTQAENSQIDLNSLEMTEQRSAFTTNPSIEGKDESTGTATATATSLIDRDNNDEESESDSEISDNLDDDKDEKTNKNLNEKYKGKEKTKAESPLYTREVQQEYRAKTKFVADENSLGVSDKSLEVDDLKDESSSSDDTGMGEPPDHDPLTDAGSSDLSFKIEGTDEEGSSLLKHDTPATQKVSEGTQSFSDGDATVIASGETFISSTPVKALLSVKAGKLKKQTFTLTEDTVVLGRSIDADITLPDPRASRKHVQIVCSDGQYIVEDLGSANGIKVNGKRVTKHLLNPQDKISIGHTVLEFMVVDPENFEELEDPSKVLEYDPEASTQMGTATTVDSKTNVKSDETLQSSKTEIVGDGFVDESIREESGLMLDTPIDSVIVDHGIREENTSQFNKLIGKLKDSPRSKSFDKKKLRMTLIFLLLLGGLGILFVGEGEQGVQGTQTGESEMAVADTSSNTGLTPEQEALAKKHYNKAREYYEQEQFRNAITEAKRALTVYPEFTQAHDIIEYSEEAIEDQTMKEAEAEERAQSEAQSAKMEALLNEADKLLLSKKFNLALTPIKEVLKIDETHNEARAMLKEALTGISSSKKVAIQRAVLRNRMMKRFDDAEKLFNSKDYVAAIKGYNSVLVMGRRTSPSIYDNATNKLKISRGKVVRGFKPRMEEIKINMNDGNYTDALRALDGILKVYPSYKKAQNLRAEAYEEVSLQVKKIYQQALIMESINDLEEAIEGYQKILKMVPSSHKYYKKALRKLKKYN